jgi:hypothetical protein
MFVSFSSKLHVEHNKRGVAGKFLRPIGQELSYIYLSMHIQHPSSKIRSMQIFIISPHFLIDIVRLTEKWVKIITEIGVFIRGEKLKLVNFKMWLLSRKRERERELKGDLHENVIFYRNSQNKHNLRSRVMQLGKMKSGKVVLVFHDYLL